MDPLLIQINKELDALDRRLDTEIKKQRRRGIVMDAILLAVVMLLLISLTSCAPKRTEHFVDGRWQRCSFIENRSCGDTLKCNGVLYECLTNIKKRAR